MINKVIIGLLIFLVVLNGSIGAYSYTLNQEIDDLNQQLAASQGEQEAHISVLQGGLDAQEVRITAVNDEIENLRGETIMRLDTLGQEIEGTSASIGEVEEKIAVITEEYSRYIINAHEVYQGVSQATVGITDGDRLAGSGFVYTSAHVVTAHHVVENLTEIYVVFPDGRVSAATVAGTSRYSDVAVLALEEEMDIEPLVMADSAMVKVGDPVFTIGSPFSLSETLTSGIVSHTNRFVSIEYDSQTRAVANIIQFDAAANSGNSGCPLLNSKGEVIGLVTARIKPEEGDGINYAVSSNKVKRVAMALIEQGIFNYPWLGVGGTDLTPRIVQEKELESIHGILVKNVLTDGPAEAAGIKVDDIIVAIDGVSIRNMADLTAYLGEYKSPDELATVKILRDKTELEITVRLGTAP